MSRVRRLLPLALLLLLLLAIGGGVAGFVVLSGGDEAGVPARGLRGSDGAPGDGGAAEGNGRRSTREHVRPDVPGGGGERSGGSPDTDGAGGDEGDPEPAIGAGAAPSDHAPERETVRGRVGDADTGAPLVGARVRSVRGGHRWYGTRTDDGGAFEVEVPSDVGDGALVELRIAKPGYRTAVVPWSGGPVDARLLALDQVPRPGAVLGFATDAAGHALSGRILLTTYDEMGDHHGLWALADEAGAFRLEGLGPGWWQLSLFDGGPSVDVIVPEGGTTRAHVVAGADPWPGTLTEEEFVARHREVSEGVPRGVTDDNLPAEEREALARRSVQAVEDLESRWRAVRPARAVVVTGLPERGTAHVRAATPNGPNQSWRVAVVEGTARLPALTPETWRLILEIPGEPDAAKVVVVPEGESPLEVEWSQPR